MKNIMHLRHCCANLALGAAHLKRLNMHTTREQGERDATAYFAAGCFWGSKRSFKSAGVIETTVGYMNGRTQNPSHRDICYSDTGHAEAVEVVWRSQSS